MGTVCVALYYSLGFHDNSLVFMGSLVPDDAKSVSYPRTAKVWYRDIGGPEVAPVEAVFIPSAVPGKAKGTVVVAHSFAGSIDLRFQGLETYTQQLGFHLLLVEYRGYKRSGGVPSVDGVVDDFRYFLNQLEMESVDPGRLRIYHGWDLGGGLLVRLSQVRPPDALIWEAPFAALTEVLASNLGWASDLLSVEIAAADILAATTFPVLLHGLPEHRFVSMEHMDALVKALPPGRAKQGVLDGTSPQGWQAYWESNFHFLRGL